jgi:hypothetical protein
MRFGAAQVMKQRTPAPEEARVVQPDWATPAIEAIQRDVVEAIRRSGVPLVGDLDRLTEQGGTHAKASKGRRGETATADVLVPPDAAAAMAMGVLAAAGEARPGRARFELAEPVQVLDVPTYQLAAVLVIRTWRGTRHLVERVVNRVRRPAAGSPPLPEP